MRHNGDIDARRLEAGINGKLNDSSKYSVKGYLYNSNRGLPAAIVNNKFDSKQREWDRSSFIQATYSKNVTTNNSLMVNAEYATDYTHYFDPEITNTRGLLDDKCYEH